MSWLWRPLDPGAERVLPCGSGGSVCALDSGCTPSPASELEEGQEVEAKSVAVLSGTRKCSQGTLGLRGLDSGGW